jgi:plastocyanin
MVGVVAYAFGGLDNLLGQLTNPTPDVTVRIKHDGTEPQIATIVPGQTVRWINDDQIPHILSSDTLPTGDGKPFNTVAMFPASDAYYTAPLTATEGAYEYISQTSPEVAGQIVISATALSVPTSSSAPLSSTPSSVIPTQSSSSQSTTTLPTQAPPSPPSFNALEGNVIAVNPYVVGTKPGSTRKPGVTEHTPTKQAESGPAIWIVLGCSAALVFFASRGAFRRV